jgi:hypothetical protein
VTILSIPESNVLFFGMRDGNLVMKKLYDFSFEYILCKLNGEIKSIIKLNEAEILVASSSYEIEIHNWKKLKCIYKTKI